jgi:cation:H+ antiporter
LGINPLDVLMLVVSLGLILLASLLFTNAVEVFGHRLGLHQGAVGSILAAVGTALPETVIPLIAILWFGDPAAQKVAIGAIAGAPFMLGTLAFFVTGAAVLVWSLVGRRAPVMRVDPSVATRDLSFFLVAYGLAVATTFVHDYAAIRWAVAVGLILSYGLYVRITLKAKAEGLADVEPLYLGRLVRGRFGTPWVIAQLAASLAVMVGGAHLFVGYTEAVATELGISPLLLSLIITPIATELPEKFNSVIWVGRAKDTLALGNITGAMVFQSCFPVAFGIVGTPWDLMQDRGITMVSALLAFAAALLAVIWLRIKKTLNPYVLLFGGALYGVFIAYLVYCHHVPLVAK